MLTREVKLKPIESRLHTANLLIAKFGTDGAVSVVHQALSDINELLSIVYTQAEEIANLKQQLEDYEHGHNAEMEGMEDQ